MIRMGRGKNDEPETPSYGSTPTASTPQNQYQSEAVSSPSRAVTDSESMARDIKEGRLSGFVGHGTVLTGETNFQAMLRVDGHLQGTVTSESGTLIVGTNGQVDANVAVSSAMVNGNVNGDILATEKIQLGRTARVIGNIQAPRIIVEDGAILEGSCLMLKAKEAVDAKAAQPGSRHSAEEYEEVESENEAEPATNGAAYLASTEEDDDEDDEKADAAVI